MAKQHKVSKHQQEVQDAQESRKFLLIIAAAVLLLMVLMYILAR